MTAAPPEGPDRSAEASARIEMHGESHDSSTFIQIGTQIIQPPPPVEVRYSLPPDTAAFTGRDKELADIVAATTDAAAVGGVVAIHAIGGMPGVGKTALAVHVAHKLRSRFPDRQLFIDLHAHTPGRDPVSPGAALADLLTATGVDVRYLPGDTDGRAGLWRDRTAGQRAVLVLDNAVSSDQVVPLLPGGEGCLVLVTSRRHLGDLPGAVIPVRLAALAADAAQAMFVRLAPRAATGPETAIQKVVQLAGYLPLAISLLARVYQKHSSWSLADLTADTQASMLTLAAEKQSVAAAFEVSYRYLNSGQQQLFRRLGLHPGTTIDAYSGAALAGAGLREASRHLDALHSEGLLTEVGYHRYGMHDLIRLYARERAAVDPAADRDRALERLLDYYQHTAAIAEARLTPTSPALASRRALAAAVPDLPDGAQALSWARAERVNLLACLDHATLADQHARIIALTAGVAALLRHDGPWTDAITRHNTAVQAARHLHDHSSEAIALRNLGVMRRLTGDYQGAVDSLEAALDIYRNLGDRPGLASALRELGAVQWLTDEYRSAAESLEAALGIFLDLGDPLGHASTVRDLGAVRVLTGDYRGAAEALEAARDIYGALGDRRGQASALSDLGNVRWLTGDYRGASEALEQAQGMFQDLGSQRGQASALSGLGIARRLSGDYRGATRALEAALGISRELGNRRGQAIALNHLGAIRRLNGDYQGAAEALEEALSSYRDLGDRGGEAEALNEAGTLHRIRSNLDRAETCHRQALDLARDIGSFRDEAHALAGLGRCALTAGSTADAQASLQQAHEIFQRIGAPEASDISAELDALTQPGPDSQSS
jgi:tetratricopeptide (TPR) repeat protein